MREKLIHVEYEVTVTALVSLETGEVIRVVVDDGSTREPSVWSQDPEGLTEAEIRHAEEIAEDRAWPRWEVGW